jgi:hypothetical protein
MPRLRLFRRVKSNDVLPTVLEEYDTVPLESMPHAERMILRARRGAMVAWIVAAMAVGSCVAVLIAGL